MEGIWWWECPGSVLAINSGRARDTRDVFSRFMLATLIAWHNPPNSRIAPKLIGEGASSLFGGWPGSPENVSCTGATPRLHRCKSGVAPVQETFSGLPGRPPKRLLAPSPINLGAIREFGGLYQAIRVANLCGTSHSRGRMSAGPTDRWGQTGHVSGTA